MASLYISEYIRMPSDHRGLVPAAETPAVTTQKITISGTSAQSAAFGATTKFVRLHTDTICSVLFGADPTATANHMRMAADQTEYFGVVAGQKLAVISNT